MSARLEALAVPLALSATYAVLPDVLREPEGDVGTFGLSKVRETMEYAIPDVATTFAVGVDREFLSLRRERLMDIQCMLSIDGAEYRPFGMGFSLYGGVMYRLGTREVQLQTDWRGRLPTGKNRRVKVRYAVIKECRTNIGVFVGEGKR